MKTNTDKQTLSNGFKGKYEMPNISRTELLSKNVLRGKIAEEIAKTDYQKHGFEITETGIGSDFKAIKRLQDSIYEEYVDVKSGNARLSKKQASTKNSLRRNGQNFMVYRVSNEYLQEQMHALGLGSFHGVFLIRNSASCPHCNLSVSGIIPILQYFGLRNMGDGTVRVQSWCIRCRNNVKFSSTMSEFFQSNDQSYVEVHGRRI